MSAPQRIMTAATIALACGAVHAAGTNRADTCAAGEEAVFAFNPVSNVCSSFINSCAIPTGWKVTTAQSCVTDHDFQIAPYGIDSNATGPTGGTTSGTSPTSNPTTSTPAGTATGANGTTPMPDYSALVTTTITAMTQWTSNLLNNLFADMGSNGGGAGSIYFPESGVMAVKCLRVSGVEDKVVNGTLKQLPPTAGSSAILFSVVEMTTADPASCGSAIPIVAGSSNDPFLDLIKSTQPY